MNSTLNDMYKSYEQDANTIVGWKKMSKTQLANCYCDEDEKGDYIKRDHYFSALMCKFWYMIPYIYSKSKTLGLDIEDIHSWIAEALMIGFKYRRWRDPNYSVYYDEKGAEKVFNQCITSTRQRWFKYFNQDKRKINQELWSLDAFREEHNEFLGDIDEDESEIMCESNDIESDDICRSVVDYYLSKGKVIEALIVDGICFYDTQKEEKYIVKETDTEGVEHSYKRTSNLFSPKLLVKHLNHIDNKFIEYFMDTYGINNEVLLNNIEKIHKSPSAKLYKYIDDTIVDLRNNKELRELICY